MNWKRWFLFWSVIVVAYTVFMTAWAGAAMVVVYLLGGALPPKSIVFCILFAIVPAIRSTEGVLNGGVSYRSSQ